MKSGHAEWHAADAGALTYTVFDPSPCGFPDPQVPLLPRLTRHSLGMASSGDYVLVGSGLKRSRTYKRGRYALYDAYRLSGVGPEGALLAPAYHCRTMLDAAISLGGQLQLYELDERLAPRLASLQRLVATARQPVRALLLTHYFGFAQDVAPIKAFCDAHDIALIEDCSHALFNLRGHESLGQYGRYTIASPYKLLPCEEGGLLIPGRDAPMPHLPNRRASFRTEASVLATMVQRQFAHRRSSAGITDADGIAEALRDLDDRGITEGFEGIVTQSGTSTMYRADEEGVAGTRVARWLMRLCDPDRVARQRRANYRRWATVVSALPHCRPLFPTLPDNCVPYMFPLLINYPMPHFNQLKSLGMPIWRWDEMALSNCANASNYRQHLLHLPCHQSLTTQEQTWMHSALSQVMSRAPD